MEERRDERIVEACLAGDGQAYAELVTLHTKRVYAMCLAMAGNATDAEDLAQEALMRGFTELGSLRNHDRFGPWIVAIAGNLCRNFLRKRANHERILAMQADCEAEEPDQSDLRHVLGTLSEHLRIPLMLYYFDGHSTESAAATLGISPAAVHKRLSRARRELRELLEKGETQNER